MVAHVKSSCWIGALVAVSVAFITIGGADAQRRGKFKPLDVPFAGTPPAGVAIMLQMANVGPADTVYDLGSGDGRIPIAAVRDFGAKAAIGIDIDPRRVDQAARNAEKAGVANRTSFIVGDIFRAFFGDATVVTLFMSHRINRELRPLMEAQLKPGTRIAAFRFPVRGWRPKQVRTLEGDDIFLYVLPAKIE